MGQFQLDKPLPEVFHFFKQLKFQLNQFLKKTSHLPT